MIVNGRGVSTSLDREGCCLVAHRSDVAYFEDRDAVPARHPAEIIDGASGPDAKTWASD